MGDYPQRGDRGDAIWIHKTPWGGYLVTPRPPFYGDDLDIEIDEATTAASSLEKARQAALEIAPKFGWLPSYRLRRDNEITWYLTGIDPGEPQIDDD